MSDQNPLVSIIIPTFNRAHLIKETLDSVLAQTYTNWECIVVDDGSTDNTHLVMAGYMAKDVRIKYHKRIAGHKPGGNGARNYGFLISKGEFIQWFDSDDVMECDLLITVIDSFQNETDLVIFNNSSFDENGLESTSFNSLKVETNLFKDYVLWRFRIITGSVIFRKSFLNNNALFNEKILRGQETEFFSRMFFKLRPEQYKVINKALFKYRHHHGTKSFAHKKYVPRFQESQAYILIENFKKSLIIKDVELQRHLYKSLIGKFFLAMDNAHKSNTSFILNNLSFIFFKRNPLTAIKIYLLGRTSSLLGKKSYRIKAQLNSLL